MRIYIDTCSLILSVNTGFGLNLWKEMLREKLREIVVFKQVLEEVRGGKKRLIGKIAENEMTVIDGGKENVDELLFEAAISDHQNFVVTEDRILRRKINEDKGKAFSLRQVKRKLGGPSEFFHI